MATSARFEKKVSSTYFELPDFPIIKTEGFMANEEFNVKMEEDMEDMGKNIEKLKIMSFEEWKELAIKDDEELRETFQMMKKMIKMRN